MAKHVLMAISDNQGYAPKQIKRSLTLGELLEQVQTAIDDFGEDAMVVLSNGQRYGAGYGSIPNSLFGDLFTADPYAEDNEEEGDL